MLRPNPRHERFAQELASGTPILEAMRRAGLSPDRGNGARLKARLQSRIDTIIAERSPPPAPAFIRPQGMSVESAAIWDSLVQQHMTAARNSDQKLVHRITNSLRFMVKKEKYNSELPAIEPLVRTRPWTPPPALQTDGELDLTKFAEALREAVGDLPTDESVKRRATDRNSKLGFI